MIESEDTIISVVVQLYIYAAFILMVSRVTFVKQVRKLRWSVAFVIL